MHHNLILTSAQQRALDWLPSDGSWRLRPGNLARGVQSLVLYYPQLAQSEIGDFGKRGGREWRHRLTEAGVRFKAMRMPTAPGDEG